MEAKVLRGPYSQEDTKKHTLSMAFSKGQKIYQNDLISISRTANNIWCTV
jgi:hypothetical protein